MSEMRNLLPDPWPVGTRGWKRFGGGADDIQLSVTASNPTCVYARNITGGDGRGVETTLSLEAGDYVFGLRLNEASQYGANGQLALVQRGSDYISIVRYQGKRKYYAAQFTLPQQSTVKLLLVLPAAENSEFEIHYLQLMSKEDWTHMRNLKNSDGTPGNIRWFAPPKAASHGVMSTPELDLGGVVLS